MCLLKKLNIGLKNNGKWEAVDGRTLHKHARGKTKMAGR